MATPTSLESARQYMTVGGGSPAAARVTKTGGTADNLGTYRTVEQLVNGSSFSVSVSDQAVMAVGLTNVTTPGEFDMGAANFAYAVAISGAAYVNFLEFGVYKGDNPVGTPNGTRYTWTFEAFMDSGVLRVRVKKNGAIVWTSTTNASAQFPLAFGVAIRSVGEYADAMDITGASSGNQAPVVSAGIDQGIAAGATATLSGSVTDPEGQPVTAQWSLVSGPSGGVPAFADATDATTTVSFAGQPSGTYVLRLTGSDGAAVGTDDITITVASATANNTIKVCASGGNYNNTQLQAAMDAALPGDTILLQRGFEYAGRFIMKPKAGATTHVHVRTGVESNGALIPESDFPPAGMRITPAYASVLAKLKVVSNNDAALETQWGVKVEYWKWSRVQFTPNAYGGDTLIRVGWEGPVNAALSLGQTVANIPANIIFDQIYVKGDALTGQFRGISIHGNDVTLKNSYFKDIKSGLEGQVVWMNSCRWRPIIENNYFEGGCETLMTGGAGSPEVTSAVASDPAPTTIGCRLTTVQDLEVGQGVHVPTATGTQYAEIASIASLDVTFAVALTAAPTIGGLVRWGLVVADGSIRLNHFTRPASWRTDPEIGQVTNLTATPSLTGGSLTAGTYHLRVVAYRETNRGAFLASGHTVVSAVIESGNTGKITLAWTAPATAGGVTKYRVYGITQAEPRSYWEFNAPEDEFIYTGQAATGTIVTVPYSESSQRVADATYGRGWFVKNTFELKQARNFLIEGNIIENSWVDGQGGPLVVLTGTTQAGLNPSAHVREITFRYNLIRNGAQLLQITGRDALNVPSGRAQDIEFRDNLCYDLAGDYGTGQNLVIIVAGNHNSYNPDRGPARVTLNHNTIIGSGHNSAIGIDLHRDGQYQPIPAFLVRNNIWKVGTYGIAGFGSGGFQHGLWTPFAGPGSAWEQNIIAGANALIHPAGTLVPSPADLDALTFTNPAADDYSFKPTSPYKGLGTDGRDLGADVARVLELTAIALSGNNTGNVVLPDEPEPLPGAATLLTPAADAVDVSLLPAITWELGARAVQSLVALGTTNPPAFYASVSGTSLTPTTPLLPSTTYHVRIDQVNASGGITPGSVRSFRTVAVAPPDPTEPSPPNNAQAVASKTAVAWAAVPGAESYDVYFGTKNPPPFVANVTEPRFDPGPLLRNTRYYWGIDPKF